MLIVLDSTLRTALAADTTQTDQAAAVVAAFLGDPVTVRNFNAAGTLVMTTVHGTPVADSSTPRGWSLGAIVRGSTVWHVSGETIARSVYRNASGTDIYSLDATDLTPSPLVVQTGRHHRRGERSTARSTLPESNVPSWVSGTAIDAWAEIPGSASQSSVPLSMAAPNSFGGSALASTRMDAWCGFAMVGRKIYSVAQGGHGDYRGNEVLAFDVDTGLWSLLLAASPPAQFQDGGIYIDGTPAANHGYYTWQPVPQRNWIVSAGLAACANDGGTVRACRVYDITANAYLAASAMPELPLQQIGAEYGVGSDPATGNVYACFSGNLYKWTQSSNTWGQVDSPNNSAGYETVLSTDTTRGRMLILSGQGSQITANLYTFATGAMTQPTMSGDGSITAAGGEWGTAFCEVTDRFYAMRSDAAAAGLYEIHPTTWAVSAKSTTGAGSMPAAVNNVFGRFKKVTYGSAGGLIYFPRHSAAAWFLRLH